MAGGRPRQADSQEYAGQRRSQAAIERRRQKRNDKRAAKRAALGWKKTEKKLVSLRRGSITIAELRAEGVRDIVRPEGTSVLFVWTEKSLRIFHASSVPDRHLDAYAQRLVANWLESGCTLEWIARALDLQPTWLSNELARAGYVLKSRVDGKPRDGATARLKAEQTQNGRRGSPVRHDGRLGFAPRSM